MIYLASPYSSGIAELMEHRYDLAMRACAGLFHQRIIVYSPIVHWHAVAKAHNLPLDYKPWAEQDEEMIRISDEVWVLDIGGWEDSSGVANDVQLAIKHGKKHKVVSMEKCLGVKGSNNESLEVQK